MPKTTAGVIGGVEPWVPGTGDFNGKAEISTHTCHAQHLSFLPCTKDENSASRHLPEFFPRLHPGGTNSNYKEFGKKQLT